MKGVTHLILGIIVIPNRNIIWPVFPVCYFVFAFFLKTKLYFVLDVAMLQKMPKTKIVPQCHSSKNMALIKKNKKNVYKIFPCCSLMQSLKKFDDPMVS